MHGIHPHELLGKPTFINRYFSLSKACLHFGVEDTNAHRAAADAIACVTVWEGMMTSHHWDY